MLELLLMTDGPRKYGGRTKFSLFPPNFEVRELFIVNFKLKNCHGFPEIENKEGFSVKFIL